MGALGLAATVLSATVLSAAPAGAVAPSSPSCTTSSGTTTCTFSFTGASQSWQVPAGVTSVRATLVGGAGAGAGTQSGGKGGLVAATFAVTPGEPLQVNVGGTASGLAGGFNGGGSALQNTLAGGGGASDIRRGAAALADRLVVAGGGGGAGGLADGTPGAGGDAGAAGAAGVGLSTIGGGGAGTDTAGGAGGSASAPGAGWVSPSPSVKDGTPGSFGVGGTVVIGNGYPLGGGGGGGGGWYGGGSGASGGTYLHFTGEGVDTSHIPGGGGGGGSSYVIPGATDTSIGTSSAAASVVIVYATPTAPPLSFDSPSVTVDAAQGLCSVTGVTPPSSVLGGMPAPTLTYSPALSGTFSAGTTTVTGTASNGVSPDASATFVVFVRDAQPPAVTGVPGNITVNATSSAGAGVTFDQPGVSDNCPGATVVQSSGGASGSTFPIGVSTIEFRATDSSANTGTASFTITVNGVAPGAPTGVTATLVRAGTMSVAFSAPASTGSSPISSYRAVCSSTDGGTARSASGPASPLAVSGLTIGARYQCRVNATNATGTGPGSAPSAAFTAVGAAGAPTDVVATRAGSGELSVAFTPPASNGGSAITSYKAVCSSATGALRTATGTGSPLTVGALTGGADYSCVAYAITAAGTGAASAASAAVTARSVPGAPTGLSSTVVSPSRVTVSFTPPASDGGSPITSYRVVCTPTAGGTARSAAGAGTTILIISLTPGAYQCRAAATNAIGTGTASLPMNLGVGVLIG
jgi:hypothetical protein